MKSRVRIGAFDYKLARRDLSKERKNELGRSAYRKLEIAIHDGQAPPVARVTLWHEIIHQLISQSSDQKLDSVKEGVIDCIAHGIVQVLRDNPWLAK